MSQMSLAFSKGMIISFHEIGYVLADDLGQNRRGWLVVATQGNRPHGAYSALGTSLAVRGGISRRGRGGCRRGVSGTGSLDSNGTRAKKYAPDIESVVEGAINAVLK